MTPRLPVGSRHVVLFDPVAQGIIDAGLPTATSSPKMVDDLLGQPDRRRYFRARFWGTAPTYGRLGELLRPALLRKGLSGFETLLPGGKEVEDWCNRAAAELLAPEGEVRARWPEVRRTASPFEALAQTFKVSPVVAARRALDLTLVDRRTFFDFYERYVSRELKGGTKPTGGNFYNNQNTRVGELFATQVVRAAMEGRIGFKQAYALTGLHGGSFQKYARRDAAARTSCSRSLKKSTAGNRARPSRRVDLARGFLHVGGFAPMRRQCESFPPVV